jgi:hypothetical protein
MSKVDDLQRQVGFLLDALQKEREDNERLRANLKQVDIEYAKCIEQRDRMTVALLYYAIPKIDSFRMWLDDEGRRAREALDMKEKDDG